jgi:hypothetical protein
MARTAPYHVGANTSTAGGPNVMMISRSLLEHKFQSFVNFRSPRIRNGQTSIVSNIMINGHGADRPISRWGEHFDRWRPERHDD